MLPISSQQGEQDARYEPDQSKAEDVRRGVEVDAGVACGKDWTEAEEEFSMSSVHGL